MANAFTNIDLSTIEAARKATLEAFRQRLIAYDANPAPRSPDLIELADVDQNADGYTWVSDPGHWEGAGAGTAIGPGDIVTLLEPVKWYWGAHDYDNQIVGADSDNYVDGVITATVNGAIPEPFENNDGEVGLEIAPIGSADNQEIGVQVGDRVFWNNQVVSPGHQGVYVVTDLGSESSPWVLTRAADHPVADILNPFYVVVEGANIVIQTATSEDDPDNILPSVASGIDAHAWGQNALATGAHSTAIGSEARAYGAHSTAIGTRAFTDSPRGMAIGADSHHELGGILIGSTAPTGGAVTSVTLIRHSVGNMVNDVGAQPSILDPTQSAPWNNVLVNVDVGNTDLEFVTANLCGGVEFVVRVHNGAESHTLTFPAGWVWVGSAMPSTIAANKTGLLTIRCITADAATDADVVATWAVEQ